MSTVPIYSVVDEEEMEKSEEEKPSGRVLFNSLSSAAAKSSRHLFSKIEEVQNSQVATAGMQMMDNFLLGSAVGVNGKKEPSLSSEPIINQVENVSENEKEENDWTSARLGFSIPTGFGLLSEERRTNIVSNFRNIYDNLKVSNLMTDYNHNPLSAEQRHETPSFYKDNDQGEFASTSSTAGDSSFFGEHDVNSEERISERGKSPSTLSENIKVNVSRKSRAKRIRLPEIDSAKLKSGDGLNNFFDKSEETAKEQNDRLRREISSSPQCENHGVGPVGLPLGDINLDRILRVINQTDDAEISPFGHDSNSNATETEDQLAHSDDSSSASEEDMTSRKSLVDTEYEDNHNIEFKDDEVSSLSVSILPIEPQDIMIESRMAEQHGRKDGVVAETPDEMIVTSGMIHKASTFTQYKEFTTSDHNEVSSRSATNSLADDTELIMDSIDEAVIAQPYMCHLNKGGYEIHSTTPSCSSSANDSSLERNNADYLIISGLVNHRTDIWTQLIAPYQICSMDICENYIAICPSAASGGLFSLQKRPRPLYRLLNTVDNGVMGGSWMQVKISGGLPTMSLAVNDSGNILWRIDSSGFAYSPVTTDPFSPVPSDNTWIGQTGEEGAITSVALTTKNAWYSTKKGVYVQLNLPEMGILFRTECPFELTKLAASDQAVWALRSDTGNLVVRIGLQHCPMGVDWVEDNLSGLPRKFVSIALYGQFGFGLDSAGNLFMINGVTESTPFGVGSWFQICSFQPHTMSMDVFSTNAKNGKRLAESTYLAPFSQWQLKVGKAGVFINAGHVILAARQPLTGHIITRVVPHRLSAMDNFTTISASGFCGESNDAIFVSLQPTAEIFVYSVRKRNFTSLPPFSHDLSRTAKYMSSSRSYLFVLDDAGAIHYRHNLRDGLSYFTNGSQPRRTSSEWATLSQIPTSNAISLAISNTSLWVITSEHKLYCMDVSQIETSDMNSWIEVDKPRGSESDKINQVRVSSTGKYVWIFVSQTGLCWARIDVSESHRQGRAWAQASSDVQISDLAVAENAVWCLSNNENELHRLRGLCLNNPAGHYWKPMRNCLKAISVDAFENRLWALDEENRIVKHEMQIYPPTCLPQANRLVSVSKASENYRTNDLMQEEKCSVDKLYKADELDRISLDPLQSWCLLGNSTEDHEEESEPVISTSCEENSLQELRYTSSLKPNSSSSYLYSSYLYL